jgi:hypothetical protein
MAFAKKAEVFDIKAPDMRTLEVTIEGDAPYCQHKWTSKAFNMMKEKQAGGGAAKAKKTREPKDFQECFEQAQYKSEDGWNGIPSTAFRAAMVSACRTVGITMTRAKLAFRILDDGFDATERKGLVRITKGEPQYYESMMRNATGVADIRARPLWEAGWQAVVRIMYDADMLAAKDVVNLLSRAGAQVGIGEGRPDSRECVGVGFGTFKIANPEGAE